MRHSSLLVALSAASSAIAAPLVEKRADFDAPAGGDIDILNYALTLEYLERKFYQEGLANYTEQDFCDAGYLDVYKTLEVIAADEASHVALLAGALGTAAVHEATYSFPSTDAASFLALASVLEGVGVSAYLGAAAAIADKTYVPIAGSILTVEARHSAFIRNALGEGAAPKPYDTPLDFNAVYSLAAQFITGFAGDDAAKLPFQAFPAIDVVPESTPVVAGETGLTFKDAYGYALASDIVVPGTKVYAVFFSGLDTYYAEVTEDGQDYILAEIPGADFSSAGQLPPSGQVYVVLSTADGVTKVTDDNTISGVGILEVSK